MPEITFPSEWLKLGNTVHEGDHIAFTDVGEFDGERESWNFTVSVIRDGKKIHDKKFTLNKTNFGAVSELYGTNSDNWIGKEMRVNKTRTRNPSTGTTVDSILLSAPNTDSKGNIIVE